MKQGPDVPWSELLEEASHLMITLTIQPSESDLEGDSLGYPSLTSHFASGVGMVTITSSTPASTTGMQA
jgi:hypothetical protein